MSPARKITAGLGVLVLALGLPLEAQKGNWEELNARAQELNKQGKYTEALPLAEEALRVAEASFGSDHPNVATALNTLAQVYHAQGRYSEAEPLYQRALAIREKALGAEHPEVAESLNNLAGLYLAQGKYAAAEPLYERSLSIREKVLGPEHPDVATSLNDLASLYYMQGNYAQAEALFERVIAIGQKVYGREHPRVAESVNNLAVVYLTQGKHVHALPLLQQALVIWEKALGPEHPQVASALNSLGGLHYELGSFAQAEPLYRRALAIWEKTLGPDHPDVATSLNNMGLLYHDQGSFAQAERLYQRSLAIREKALGPEHPDVATSLNNLARLYRDQGRYAQAEPLYQRSLAIREKALGPEHPHVAVTLNNLAALYQDQGRHAEAEPLYQRSLAIREKALGRDHPEVAFPVNNLANLYHEQGRYLDAEPFYLRALAIREKALGRDHPSTGWSLANLAMLYYARQLPQQAEPFFQRSLENLARQFQYHFTYMSEKERLLFLDKVAEAFPLYYSFCFTYRRENPALLGQTYDVLLWQKGFIAQSIAALRAQIAASGDAEALRLFEELTAKKTQLAKLLSAEPRDRAAWKKRVEQMEQEANEVERELVKRSAALAEAKRLARVSWQDVQKALKKEEAVVEFARFRYHDGKRWTDKTYYVALIVTPQTKTAPVLVVLGEAEQLEGAALRQYRELVGAQGGATGEAQGVYAAFWKPLEGTLRRSKRVYLSPDGLLNVISWGVLSTDKGRRLLEAYDVRVLSSTKDLLRGKGLPTSGSAVLIGNPRFDLAEEKQRAAAQSIQKEEEPQPALLALVRGLRSREQAVEVLSPLPGTKAELDSIHPLLERHAYAVQVYEEEAALEEVLKRLQRPRLLHVATHGFFLSDQGATRGAATSDLPSGREDPMLRSGLYFAGANRVLQGTPPPPDLDDGILTAYEASELNLHGTELVVLSACETGLGQVKNGEGVFGLRRALQVAGAEAVLMSLWAVPDRETQELMTLFYQQWLTGRSKPEALRQAQLAMKKTVKARYGRDLPFYWGAFVLVGR